MGRLERNRARRRRVAVIGAVLWFGRAAGAGLGIALLLLAGLVVALVVLLVVVAVLAGYATD